jgi:hypothetical protein
VNWVLGVLVVLALSFDGWDSEPAAWGQCTELKPLCRSGQTAECVCDDENQCSWVCVAPASR